MQNENKNFFASTLGIIVAILLVLCCCCFIIVAGGLGGIFYIGTQSTPPYNNDLTPFKIEITPFDFGGETATPAPVEITRVPVENIPTETINTLRESVVPDADPRGLACRLGKKCNIPETKPSDCR